MGFRPVDRHPGVVRARRVPKCSVCVFLLTQATSAMLSFARKMQSAITRRNSNKSQGKPVSGILLDDNGDEMRLEGMVLKVDDQGVLDLGDVDHLLGADEEAFENLQVAEITSLDELEGQLVCAICQDNFQVGDMVRWLPCEHCFHQECVDQWLHVSTKCPLCECPVNEDHEAAEGHGAEEVGQPGPGAPVAAPAAAAK